MIVADFQKLDVPYLCSRRIGIAGVVEQTQKRQVIEMLVNWLSTSMSCRLHDCTTAAPQKATQPWRFVDETPTTPCLYFTMVEKRSVKFSTAAIFAFNSPRGRMKDRYEVSNLLTNFPYREPTVSCWVIVSSKSGYNDVRTVSSITLRLIIYKT